MIQVENTHPSVRRQREMNFAAIRESFWHSTERVEDEYEKVFEVISGQSDGFDID